MNALITALRFGGPLTEWFARLIWMDFLKEAPENMFFDQSVVDRYLPAFTPQTRFPGYRRAILRSIANMPVQDFIETHSKVGKNPRPVLILWGNRDTVTPIDGPLAAAQAAYPSAQIAVLKDVGHVAQYEAPDQANPVILKFLRQGRAPSDHAAKQSSPK